MTAAPKTGYARLAGPDVFGVAMRGKLSAIGCANPPQSPSMFSPNIRFLLTVRLP